jgi:hypothetical protein
MYSKHGVEVFERVHFGQAVATALLRSLHSNPAPAFQALRRSLIQSSLGAFRPHWNDALHPEFSRLLDHPLEVIEFDQRGIQKKTNRGRVQRQALQGSELDLLFPRDGNLRKIHLPVI